MIYSISAWFNGWRYDYDGWLVRARRANDKVPYNGFLEEACIAVRNPKAAWEADWTSISATS